MVFYYFVFMFTFNIKVGLWKYQSPIPWINSSFFIMMLDNSSKYSYRVWNKKLDYSYKYSYRVSKKCYIKVTNNHTGYKIKCYIIVNNIRYTGCQKMLYFLTNIHTGYQMKCYIYSYRVSNKMLHIFIQGIK